MFHPVLNKISFPTFVDISYIISRILDKVSLLRGLFSGMGTKRNFQYMERALIVTYFCNIIRSSKYPKNLQKLLKHTK